MRTRTRIIALPLLTLILGACSVYKSTVRKQFETNSPDRAVTTSLTPASCENLSAFPAWLQKEFPDESAEMLISNSDFEVWKQFQPEGRIQIRSFRQTEMGTQTCTQVFADEESWEAHREHYLRVLQSPILD